MAIAAARRAAAMSLRAASIASCPSPDTASSSQTPLTNRTYERNAVGRLDHNPAQEELVQYAGYVARRATMMELHGYQSRVNIYADDPNAFADEVRHHI
jgi:hypothetical protein